MKIDLQALTYAANKIVGSYEEEGLLEPRRHTKESLKGTLTSIVRVGIIVGIKGLSELIKPESVADQFVMEELKSLEEIDWTLQTR